MVCIKCHSEIAVGTVFCPICGARQEALQIDSSLNAEIVMADTYVETKQTLNDWQIKEFKTARRKLFIRVASLILFLLGNGIFTLAAGGKIGEFFGLSVPSAFWGSLIVTYLFGDGIIAFFKKVWELILGAIASILAVVLYFVVVLILLLIVGFVLSLIANVLPEWVGYVLIIAAMYSGVVINIIGGIKNYNSYVMYKDEYLRYKQLNKRG